MPQQGMMHYFLVLFQENGFMERELADQPVEIHS